MFLGPRYPVLIGINNQASYMYLFYQANLVHIPSSIQLIPSHPRLPFHSFHSLGMKTLQECVSLDPKNMRPPLEPNEIKTLKQAVLQLDLHFWLKEHGLDSVLSLLVKKRYTSRQQLYSMDQEDMLQVHVFHYWVSFRGLEDSQLLIPS